ncbi:hypothetical protein [Cohnella hashimotonis]|uniref:Uncharacterized protein n=1 Tax=Cohnella hashimotonis TaxID=2826895 RepID=A0ABT6TH81_9BACL|nr:hypothetical protein [Cohnella hashimotonis]MDI4645670.1 hypothetical protein [Cohnella hashimotonis]
MSEESAGRMRTDRNGGSKVLERPKLATSTGSRLVEKPRTAAIGSAQNGMTEKKTSRG